MKNKKVSIFLIGFFVVFSAAFMLYYYNVYYSVNKHKEKSLPYFGSVEHRVAPFSFVDQKNKIITQDVTDGKIYLVEYFFATCEGICPKMNENLNLVYQNFRGNPNVLFLSHTVDPEEDTPEALNEYAKRFEADENQWHFLTGDKKELYDHARYSYMISAQDDTTGLSIDKDFIHDNHFILIDRHRRIRGVYDGLKPEDMKLVIKDINTLLASGE